MSVEKWYCTDHLNYPVNAGSKAARDTAQIAERNVAELIPFYAPKERRTRYAALLSAVVAGVKNWLRLARRVKKDEWVLLQHPHEYIRVAAYFIDRLKRMGYTLRYCCMISMTCVSMTHSRKITLIMLS